MSSRILMNGWRDQIKDQSMTQLVACWFWVPEVEGSNPSALTIEEVIGSR